MRNIAKLAVGGAVLAATAVPWVGSTSAKAFQFNGAPLKIMAIGGYSSPTPTLVAPEARSGAQARVMSLNAAGGVVTKDGKRHRLELTTCDTEVDVNKAGDCARQAVAEGDLAIVGMPGTELSQVYPILEQNSMASLGALPTTPVVGDSPSAWCFGPAAPGELVGLVGVLKQAGAGTVSALYPGDIGPATAVLSSTFDYGIKKYGVTVGAKSTFPLKSTQFDAAVANAITPSTNGVVVFNPGTSTGPLIAAVKAASSKVLIATTDTSVTAPVFQYLGNKANGMYGAGFGMPETSKVKGIKMFNTDMNRYFPGVVRTDLAINAWLAVDSFARIAATQKAPDRASILKAIRNLHNFDMLGIYPRQNTSQPFTKWPGMTCVGAGATVLLKAKGGKWYPLVDKKFTYPF